jgi:hypothetical protein
VKVLVGRDKMYYYMYMYIVLAKLDHEEVEVSKFYPREEEVESAKIRHFSCMMHAFSTRRVVDGRAVGGHCH